MTKKPYKPKPGGSYERDAKTGRLKRISGTEPAPLPKPTDVKTAETVAIGEADKAGADTSDKNGKKS